METPNFSTPKSQTTMNLTSSSGNSIKNRIEIDSENSPYVKGGYIFEFDKAKGGAYKYTYFTYGISQYPSDIENFGAEYIRKLDTLEDIKLAAGIGVKVEDQGIRMYYKTGNPGCFMGKAVVGGKTISYRVAKAITAFNPEFDGKNDVGIAITDSDGILLLGNLVLENLINDIVFCTDSIGNVTVFDDNNISNCGKVGLTVRSVDKLIGLPENSIVTIKKDVYITAQSFVKNNDVTVILDGGNLYRHHKVYALPNKIICKNGAVIDVPSDCQKLHLNNISGASQTHVMDANENCCFGLFGSQNNVVVEFNPMDFVKATDYAGKNSAAAINLNNVFERIFRSIYNSNNQGQRMLIKMPETHYGGTNFYMDRPLLIPHNVTIDMSGAFVFIADGFDSKDVDYIFAFETNRINPIHAASIIKNMTIRFSPRVLFNRNNVPEVEEPYKNAKFKHVFDLTHFQGTLEEIKIYLNNNTEIIAFWQPFGTPRETYSDRKIIRRCSVGEFGWRNETPVAIFCEGDGCIIEQCILGFVAIICGSSYTIKGCLNDKYFLYDTTADFSGSYWEVGQFEILNSKVTFSNCKLHASNNNFTLSHPSNLRYYIGPWMAIDTEGCRKRLINLFKKHELNLDRFNQISENRTYGGLYRGCAVSENSTVKFDSTVTSTQTYWGYKQPMSGPLFKIGEGAKVIGIENLESLTQIFIYNSLKDEKNEKGEVINTAPDRISVNVTQPARIPLVNGDFADVKSDIIVPTNLTFNVYSAGFYEDDGKTQNIYKDKEKEMGFDWGGEKFTNIRARFVLDRQRKLYSSEFKTTNKITTVFGEYARMLINCDMSEQTYNNLKLELLFSFGKGLNTDTYIMRQHYNRTVNANLFCFGKNKNGDDVNNILPSYSTNIMIGDFTIVKAYCNLEELEAQKMPNSEVQPVEHVEIDDDMPKPTNKALCDYCGNMYEPISNTAISNVNEATRIQWIGENNVRAFMSALPQYGTWNDGDEIVLQTAAYRYFGGSWYQYITFRNGTLQPVDPGDSGITIDPIKPIVP